MPFVPRKRTTAKKRKTNMYQRTGAYRGTGSTSQAVAMRSAQSARAGSYTDSKNAWSFNNRLARLFNPFPDRLSLTLRYSDQKQIVCTAGVSTVNQFRPYSIYDPDYTSAGHQPYGYDQIAALYNHYFVRKAVMTVIPLTPYNGRLCSQLTDDTSVQASVNTVNELKDTITVYQSVASRPNMLRIIYDPSKVFPGKTPEDLSAIMTANPTEGQYFNIQVYGDNNTASVTIYCIVNIEFVVDVWELQDFGGS